MKQKTGKSDDLAGQMAEITAEIYHLAEQNQNDVLFLLSLLRNLEQIHRQIRTTMFETSLPGTRNDLYNLVKDIEEQGGWPYIERMKLQKLLKNLKSDLFPDSLIK